MNKQGFEKVTQIGRNGFVVPLLLLTGGLSGCGNRSGPAQYTGSGLSAPSRGEGVPEEVQAEIHKQIKRFVANIRRDDYASARKQMSPTLRARTPSTVTEWLETGHYEALTGATDWRFDSTTYSSGGKKLVVRAGFKGPENVSFRTNFVFSQSGKSWQIDMILPPTQQVAPVKQESGGTSAPPGG